METSSPRSPSRSARCGKAITFQLEARFHTYLGTSARSQSEGAPRVAGCWHFPNQNLYLFPQIGSCIRCTYAERINQPIYIPIQADSSGMAIGKAPGTCEIEQEEMDGSTAWMDGWNRGMMAMDPLNESPPDLPPHNTPYFSMP